ncbi:MAG: hypothetical protein J07HQX50_01647 [Haloquadratum sp. J07HQX50]|nr:MAG: hypothetical protein J07HQX50_01647 [Haloquadratum sp. J07HQX50]
MSASDGAYPRRERRGIAPAPRITALSIERHLVVEYDAGSFDISPAGIAEYDFLIACVTPEVDSVVEERCSSDKSMCATELVDVNEGWATHRVSPS